MRKARKRRKQRELNHFLIFDVSQKEGGSVKVRAYYKGEIIDPDMALDILFNPARVVH